MLRLMLRSTVDPLLALLISLMRVRSCLITALRRTVSDIVRAVPIRLSVIEAAIHVCLSLVPLRWVIVVTL